MEDLKFTRGYKISVKTNVEKEINRKDEGKIRGQKSDVKMVKPTQDCVSEITAKI